MEKLACVVLLALLLPLPCIGTAKADLDPQWQRRGIEPIARPGEALMPRGGVIKEIISPTIDQPIGMIFYSLEDDDLMPDTYFGGPR